MPARRARSLATDFVNHKGCRGSHLNHLLVVYYNGGAKAGMAISSLPSKHAEAAPCPIDTPTHNIQGPVSQVMTVGLSRPVNSTSLEMSNATEMMGASAACASSLCLDTSSLYCSMYILRRAGCSAVSLHVHSVVLCNRPWAANAAVPQPNIQQVERDINASTVSLPKAQRWTPPPKKDCMICARVSRHG